MKPLLALALFLLSALPLAAQTSVAPAPGIEPGVAAYQNLDYQNAAELLRRALHGDATLDLAQEQRAYSYLGASEFFLGHHDASVLAFREMCRLDARIRLDPLVFPPDVQRVYEEARRTVRIVQAEVPGETALHFGKDELPIRLWASGPQNIVVTASRDAGNPDLVTLYTGPITDSLDLTWDGRTSHGSPAPTGAYSIRVSTLVGGQISRTVRVPLQVRLERQDTVALPREPQRSQYRAERSMGVPLKSVIRGFAMGMLAIGLPAAMGADARSMVGPLIVGGAISAAGLADLLIHSGGARVETNIAYNEQLHDTWRQRRDSLTAENRRRRDDVRLVIHADHPVTQEGSLQ